MPTYGLVTIPLSSLCRGHKDVMQHLPNQSLAYSEATHPALLSVGRVTAHLLCDKCPSVMSSCGRAEGWRQVVQQVVPGQQPPICSGQRPTSAACTGLKRGLIHQLQSGCQQHGREPPCQGCVLSASSQHLASKASAGCNLPMRQRLLKKQVYDCIRGTTSWEGWGNFHLSSAPET